jgi:hypothetical protein
MVCAGGDAASVESLEQRQRQRQSMRELAERDSLAKELFKLWTDFSPDVLIGIDPGMRSLVTAVTVGRLRRRRRKRGGGVITDEAHAEPNASRR